MHLVEFVIIKLDNISDFRDTTALYRTYQAAGRRFESCRAAPSVDVAQTGRAAAKPPKVYPVLILRILQHLLFFNWYENNIVFCLIFHSVTFIFDIMLLILL